jgi:hypothetical protein
MDRAANIAIEVALLDNLDPRLRGDDGEKKGMTEKKRG